MKFYYVIMFVHITSAVALFMGMAIEWTGINRIHIAVNKDQVKDWLKFLLSLKSLFITAGILLFITGGYMASDNYGWTPWIIVSVILWLYIVLHGSIVMGKKFKAVGSIVNSGSDNAFSGLLVSIQKLNLKKHLQSELAVGFGTIFIMTVKPNLVGSVCVVLVAVVLGIAPFMMKRNDVVPAAGKNDA